MPDALKKPEFRSRKSKPRQGQTHAGFNPTLRRQTLPPLQGTASETPSDAS
jgi:hypothetical protein